MKVVHIICGVITSVSFIFLIFYSTFMQSNQHDALGWLVFFLSIITGILVGLAFIKFPKVGNFFLGFISGYGIGLMIFNTIVYAADSYWVLWSLTIGLGLISGGLILWIPEILIIHSTAFFGAFFLVNGIGMFAGHNQNPFTIIELLRNGEVQRVDPYFYIYVGSAVLFYIIGAYYQHRKLQYRKIPKNISIRGRILSIN